MSHSLSAMIFAASAFAFVTPLAATAKGYQPSTVDSTAIEGQFLIAKAAKTKAQCEDKGKYWEYKASYEFTFGLSETRSGWEDTDTDRDTWCNTDGISSDSLKNSRCEWQCNF